MKFKKTTKILGATTLAVLGSLAINPEAKAFLTAYEGFDYAVGSQLNGLNGGFGFGDMWRSPGTLDNSQIVAGSFTYDDGFGNIVSTTGNRVHVTGDGISDGLPGAPSASSSQSPQRHLANYNGTVGNSTTWISFMSLRTGLPAPAGPTDGEGIINYGRAAGVQLFYNSNPTSTAQGSELVSIGRGTQFPNEPAGTPNDTWGLLYHGNSLNTTATSDDWTTPTKANSTADFILMRVDHVNGVQNPYDDSLSVWLNPRLDLEGALGAADLTLNPGDWAENDRDLAFNVIRFFGGNYNAGVDNYGSLEVDELKIGTEFLDVTIAPIPEPTVLALFGLGGLAMIQRMRRK